MQGKEKEDTNLGVSDRDREAENGAVSQEPRKKMISRSRELLCLFFFFFKQYCHCSEQFWNSTFVGVFCFFGLSLSHGKIWFIEGECDFLPQGKCPWSQI